MFKDNCKELKDVKRFGSSFFSFVGSVGNPLPHSLYYLMKSKFVNNDNVIHEYGLRLKPQEILLDDPWSKYFFTTQPFLATPNALEVYGEGIIIKCLGYLQRQAKQYNGLDYLQVFEDTEGGRPNLWFIDDGEGGATTALLPEDY